MQIVFVIPVYNERDTLEALMEGIAAHTVGHDFRILFVDDGSTDGSSDLMRRLRQIHPNVDFIRLRRNFGKSSALAVGFGKAVGDLVFTMDADLQDDPCEIPRFIEKLNEGYDVVSGWKAVRHDPWHKTLPSRVFNWFTSRSFGLDIHDINCGYKLYRAEVVKNIAIYGELHRVVPALAASLGYRVAEIPVEHHPRRFGRSKFGFERFSRGALDVMTTLFLGRFLYRPGHFFGKAGLSILGLGILSVLAAIVVGLRAGPIYAATLAVIAVVLVTGGFVMQALGLLAELLVRQHVPPDVHAFIAEQHVGAPDGDAQWPTC